MQNQCLIWIFLNDSYEWIPPNTSDIPLKASNLHKYNDNIKVLGNITYKINNKHTFTYTWSQSHLMESVDVDEDGRSMLT